MTSMKTKLFIFALLVLISTLAVASDDKVPKMERAKQDKTAL